jgi:magnesium transporter
MAVAVDLRNTGRRVGSWIRPLRRALRGWRFDESRSGAGVPAGDWLVDCAIYTGGRRRPGDVDFRAARRSARRSGGFVWLGLRDPSAEEFAAVADAYGLDELAARQAVTGPHRPKIERSGPVTMFVLRTTRYVEHGELTETSEVVETGEVLIFIGDGFVVTVRHGAPGELSPVRAHLESRPDLLRHGPWAVAYAICDRLVDTYLSVSDGIEVDLDAIEEQVFARTTGDRIAHIYQLKRELMEFKRAVAPLQRPMAALLEDRGTLPPEIWRYFRDVNDHLLRVVERVAGYDDLLNSILAARLAQVSVTQNNDMRKIASWAAIAAMQTAIAGVYGMNFDHMPELHWLYGYPLVVGVMVVGAVILYRAFRRSGWL